jgi:hypothetical protein
MTCSEEPIHRLSIYNSNVFIFEPLNGASRVIISHESTKISASDRKNIIRYIYSELFLEKGIEVDLEICKS